MADSPLCGELAPKRFGLDLARVQRRHGPVQLLPGPCEPVQPPPLLCASLLPSPVLGHAPTQ